MKNKEIDLISIIVPVYNSSNFLKETIYTVINQTYKNWELIFVDDCSTDNSVDIIKKFMKDESRIKLLKLSKNSGVSIARNKGIDEAIGKFLCFLDSDDFWDKDKLKKQIKFMKKNKYEFSYTGYQFVDSLGNFNGSKVFVPLKIDYKRALKNTTIWTSTVMFDMNKLTKEDVYMINVESEDTATWWKLLKKIDYAYGINEILAYYRRSRKTLSSNKLKAIKKIWNLYRKVEKFNIIKSFYYFCFWAFNAVRRRI